MVPEGGIDHGEKQRLMARAAGGRVRPPERYVTMQPVVPMVVPLEETDMKTVTGVSLSILILACAPSAPPNPPGDQTADSTAVPAASAGQQATDSVPTEGLEAAGATHQFAVGQTLYVPVYSHVYVGRDKRAFNLACTLSIRNIDLDSPISIITVDYYNTEGALIRHFLDQTRVLAPLETMDFYIPERDTTGGSGANFIVRWGSPTAVDPPIVEAVMIGVDAGQGISFVKPAREITE